MSVVRRHNAVVFGSIALLCSLALAGWTQLVSGNADALSGVSFPTGTMVGYAVGASALGGGSVYKTTDGGATWVSQNPMTMHGLRAVFFKDDNTGFAVGDAGTIVKTTDGGTTWSASTQGTYPLTYVAFPSKGMTGYIGVQHPDSGAAALKSTDGGATWHNLPAGHIVDKATGAGFGTDNQGVIFGITGLVLGTTDGGDTFNNLTSGAPTSILRGAAFSPTTPNKCYVIGQDTTTGYGVIRYTATFGPLFDTVPVVRAPFITGGFNGICMPLDTLAFICGANGFIGATRNAHDVWTCTVPSGLTAPLNDLSFPNGGDTGYCVGAGGTILKTTDAGQPWIPGVAEGKAPATLRTGIRVLSNPCRYGIAVHADARVPVTVFDATGRAVLNQTATAGFNLLPVRKAGAYFVKSGTQTARAVVTD